MIFFKLLSHFWLFATPWTVACQASPSMGFSRQEYWSGLPFPSPGDFPNPGIEPRSPTLQADSLLSEPPGKQGVKVKVAQSCLALWDFMDYTVHGILQVRILKWETFPFSRESFQARDWTQFSCIAGRFFISWASREEYKYTVKFK